MLPRSPEPSQVGAEATVNPRKGLPPGHGALDAETLGSEAEAWEEKGGRV